MVLLIAYMIPMTNEVSGSRYSDGPHREGTMPSRFAIWIAVPVLCAMTWAAAPANECGRLCDLNWMSKASVAEVKAEIDAGADPLAPGKQGRTPLHLATLANPDPSVAVLLIERGANLESRSRFSGGGSPLHLAAGGYGISLSPYASVELYAMARLIIRTQGLNQFLKKKYELERTVKLTGNRIEVVEILLDSGAKVDARDNRDATPLHRAAAATANPDILDLLLNRGAGLEAKDRTGLTPLHWAAIGNTTAKVVRRLLDRGADIGAHSAKGATPLHLAARNFNAEVLAIFLEHGAAVEAKDEGKKTPLHYAAESLIPNAAKLLIDHGADLESRDRDGRTPLHAALGKNENPAVAILFIERGADVHARDGEGRRPRDIMEPNKKDLIGWSAGLYERLSKLLP